MFKKMNSKHVDVMGTCRTCVTFFCLDQKFEVIYFWDDITYIYFNIFQSFETLGLVEAFQPFKIGVMCES